MTAPGPISFAVTTVAEKKAVCVKVIGASPIKKTFNSVMFYPDLLEVVYLSVDSAPWKIDHIVLSGPAATKAGRSYKSAASESYSGSWQLDRLPAWAREWAEVNMPAKDLCARSTGGSS